MSKIGRYSADRKKIEALTASKTATVADCGTVFTAVGDAAVVLTLPAIADAGNGWWCNTATTDDCQSAGRGSGVLNRSAACDGAVRRQRSGHAESDQQGEAH